MNKEKWHYIVDWFVIIIFAFFIITTMTFYSLWLKFTYIAPIVLFLALCILLINNISIKEYLKSTNREIYLVSGGIIISIINIWLIKSNLGCFFTVADFLLVLFLANKIHFDTNQKKFIFLICFFVFLYWQFINKDTYIQYSREPNGIAMIILSNYYICICCFADFMLPRLESKKWIYYFIVLACFFMIVRRLFALNCRSALIAISVWLITYYFLPKKKYTIFIVIGISLLIPIIYVILGNSTFSNNIIVFGKQFFSGRDIIWNEFFNAFIQHPITGIGSDFERMVPNLYIKEVHHALLDILFVHGTLVFLIVLYFFYKRIEEIFISPWNIKRTICIASIYGMITSGTFENYYIVSPFNIMLLLIFMISFSLPQEKVYY